MNFLQDEPPIDPGLMAELAALWEETFGPGNAEFRALVECSEISQNRNIVYTARDGDRLAGTAQLILTRSSPILGGVGEVVTPPEYRRQGIARRQMTQLRDAFVTAGGMACFLGTVNPDARRLYEELGWRQFDGATVMCLDSEGRTPNEFLDDFFERNADCELITVTPGRPEHRLAMIPLILFPHASPVLDQNVNLFSTRVAVQNSCMGLYPRYSSLHETQGGTWFAASNTGGRIVGLGSLLPVDDRVAQLDWFTHERYPEADHALLESLLSSAADLGFGQSVTSVAMTDARKRTAFEQVGFDVLKEAQIEIANSDPIQALKLSRETTWRA